MRNTCIQCSTAWWTERHDTGLTALLCAGDREYDAFVHKFGRRHRTIEEYWGRQQVFADNVRLIEEHNTGNTGNASHKCGPTGKKEPYV